MCIFGGGEDEKESHDERVFEMAERLDALGYTDVRADHVSQYKDPEKKNGHVPDITADQPFGLGEIVEEIDTDPGVSDQEQKQLEDIEESLDPFDDLFYDPW